MEYSMSMSAIHAFMSRISSRPMGVGLAKASRVKLNWICSGIGCFSLSMHKWDLVLSPTVSVVPLNKPLTKSSDSVPFIEHSMEYLLGWSRMTKDVGSCPSFQQLTQTVWQPKVENDGPLALYLLNLP